jgi:hypothetical protein
MRSSCECVSSRVSTFVRYTHRGAIANSRLVEIADDEVAFIYNDCRHNSRGKIMRIRADEFIRRFPPPRQRPNSFRGSEELAVKI